MASWTKEVGAAVVVICASCSPPRSQEPRLTESGLDPSRNGSATLTKSTTPDLVSVYDSLRHWSHSTGRRLRTHPWQAEAATSGWTRTNARLHGERLCKTDGAARARSCAGPGHTGHSEEAVHHLVQRISARVLIGEHTKHTKVVQRTLHL